MLGVLSFLDKLNLIVCLIQLISNLDISYKTVYFEQNNCPDSVKVENNFLNSDFQFIPTNEFANPGAKIREFNTTLLLSISNESTFNYTICLSATYDSHIVVFNFAIDREWHYKKNNL